MAWYNDYGNKGEKEMSKEIKVETVETPKEDKQEIKILGKLPINEVFNIVDGKVVKHNKK